MHDSEITVKSEIDLEDAFSHLPIEFRHLLSEIVDQPTIDIEKYYVQTIKGISYMFYHGLKCAIDKDKIFLTCNSLYTALSGYTYWKECLDDALAQHDVRVPDFYLRLTKRNTIRLNRFRRSVNSALSALKKLSKMMEKTNIMTNELKEETECFIDSIQFAKRQMNYSEDTPDHSGFGHPNLLNRHDIVFAAVVAALPQNTYLPIFYS